MRPKHEAQFAIKLIGTIEKVPISRDFVSGASRDRTGDLLLAKQALSQLSYGPLAVESSRPLVNRVGAGLTPAPPTPPGMRVRTGRQ